MGHKVQIKKRSLSVVELTNAEREILGETRHIVQSTKNSSHAVARLRKIGYRVEAVGEKGHYRVSHRITGNIKFSLGSSPSDRRFALNFIREIKHAILARHVA